MLGLGNVDNTSDDNKSVSVATQSCISNLQNQIKTLDSRPMFGARLFGNGTTSINLGSIGMSSVIQNPTGVYTITCNSARPNNNNYLIFATIPGSTGAGGYSIVVNNANDQIEI